MSDEYRHAGACAERWAFDAVAPDGSWALHTSLTLTADVAQFVAVVARVGEPLLLVRDDSLSRPRPATLEVRGSGLWADLHCHTPMRRWQVNFEGIALALDPADVGVHEVGDRVPVEFEFEWEAVESPTATPDGYVQRCMADGDAQIGTGALGALDAPTRGFRSHTW